jgi:hypothetical protein
MTVDFADTAPLFDNLDEMLVYLDDLRESGITNMYGATAWLTKEYGLNRRDAKSVLTHWMTTYEKRQAE